MCRKIMPVKSHHDFPNRCNAFALDMKVAKPIQNLQYSTLASELLGEVTTANVKIAADDSRLSAGERV
jgi:hypothetical protein